MKEKKFLRGFTFLSVFLITFFLLQPSKNLPQKAFENIQKNFPQKKIEKKIEVPKEKANEIIISKEGKEEKIKVQPQLKKVIKEKLISSKKEPLVEIEKIKTLGKLEKPKKKVKKELYIVIVKKKKGYKDFLKKLEIKSTPLEGEKFLAVLIQAKIEEIKSLLSSPFVEKIGDKKEIGHFLHELEERLKKERDEKIKKLKLYKTHRDLPSRKEDLTKVSPSFYQSFITPDEPAIKKLSQGLSRIEVYKKVTSFTWVSDSLLNGVPEKWLLPKEFLVETPKYKTNPLPGEPVSDCSEQANTLVSMLRSIGVPAEEVRVVLGKVNFAGNIGGHAWVEIKEDGEWMALDPTSGPYWDEIEQRKIEREGLPYDYFKYHPYPVVEVWYYYNDKYFTEAGKEWSEEVSPPVFWKESVIKSQKQRLEQDIKKSFKEEKRSFWEEIFDFFKKIIDFFKKLF